MWTQIFFKISHWIREQDKLGVYITDVFCFLMKEVVFSILDFTAEKACFGETCYLLSVQPIIYLELPPPTACEASTGVQRLAALVKFCNRSVAPKGATSPAPHPK